MSELVSSLNPLGGGGAGGGEGQSIVHLKVRHFRTHAHNCGRVAFTPS